MSWRPFPGNTQDVEIDGVRNVLTGVYNEDATVSLEVLDSASASIGTATMTNVSGSVTGKYRGQIASTWNIVADSVYTLKVTSTHVDGNSEQSEPATAAARPFLE